MSKDVTLLTHTWNGTTRLEEDNDALVDENDELIKERDTLRKQLEWWKSAHDNLASQLSTANDLVEEYDNKLEVAIEALDDIARPNDNWHWIDLATQYQIIARKAKVKIEKISNFLLPENSDNLRKEGEKIGGENE